MDMWTQSHIWSFRSHFYSNHEDVNYYGSTHSATSNRYDGKKGQYKKYLNIDAPTVPDTTTQLIYQASYS